MPIDISAINETSNQKHETTENLISAAEQLELLNRQIKELVGVYRDAMVDSGHSENEFWIWYTLIVMEGEHAQQDICGMWSLTKQTVNNIILRMMKEGHVTLELVPGTRNRKIIRLTESGRVFGEQLIGPITVGELKAFARLNLNERTACMSALNQYIRYLKDELSAAQLKCDINGEEV